MSGGGGFLGSALVPFLLHAGHAVTVLDTFLHGQPSLLPWCGHPDLEIIREDVRHTAALTRAVRGADAIIPLAGVVGAGACEHDQTAARTVNLDAIRLLLRIRSASQRLVYPMTQSAYGIGPDEPCTEESPHRPVSLYGKLKVAAEEAVLDADNTVSLRLATLFGASPRMRWDLLVNDFTRRAASDGWLVLFEGRARRCVLHVTDAARAFLWALEGRPAHRVYNVGAETLTKHDLCHRIHAQVPAFHWVQAEWGRDPDQRDYQVDCARIFAERWKPERTLEEGINELLKAYRITPYRDGYANA